MQNKVKEFNDMFDEVQRIKQFNASGKEFAEKVVHYYNTNG